MLGLVPVAAGRLLDVGCGTGIVTRRPTAARPRLRVTGTDLAGAMVRPAAARLPDQDRPRADPRFTLRSFAKPTDG